MAFTLVPIVHNFENSDGSAASGTVRFTLTERMTNSGTTIMPSNPITATLVSGALSQDVPANDDAGTVPSDAKWQVTIEINGASTEEWVIVVPSAGGHSTNVDLFSLIPSQSQVE